jgi:hypothetical protein
LHEEEHDHGFFGLMLVVFTIRSSADTLSFQSKTKSFSEHIILMRKLKKIDNKINKVTILLNVNTSVKVGLLVVDLSLKNIKQLADGRG